MGSMKRKEYEALLEPMQLELVALVRWLQHSGKRLLVILEGRDTSGKSGVIQAISQYANPRQCKAVALSKPSEAEQGQWYFQRYVAHLPCAGQITLFDRSWYNRAGVEKVMGFATPAQVKAFLAQAPVFEELLVDDGILLFKYWLCTDQDEQESRFAERVADPLKAWKLSPIDVEARRRYDDYTDARAAMLAATHTKKAPWTLVDFEDQRVGRLTLIRDLLDRVPDTHVPPGTITFEPLVGKPRSERYGELKPIKPFKA